MSVGHPFQLTGGDGVASRVCSDGDAYDVRTERRRQYRAAALGEHEGTRTAAGVGGDQRPLVLCYGGLGETGQCTWNDWPARRNRVAVNGAAPRPLMGDGHTAYAERSRDANELAGRHSSADGDLDVGAVHSD